MNVIDIEKTRAELMNSYPGCRAQIADDGREIVAEISDGFAVAVIESSAPHFHMKTREIYKVLRGRLFVACGGSPRSARAVRSSHARAFRATSCAAPTQGSPSISCRPARMKL